MSRLSGHHRIMEARSPRDDGFRSGILFLTHTSESPEQWKQ